MDRIYEERKQAVLEECRIDADAFDGLEQRLVEFVEPFAARLVRCEQRQHTQTYISGLLSDVERKNTESIAYRHDQERRNLQRFLGESTWDHEPLLDELALQVGRELGESDGVIMLDPSGFAKKGDHSVGVNRQWMGRQGKIDNGQVGVYMGYASRTEHALVDFRLYLPKVWSDDRPRCRACGVPAHVRYRKRQTLALEMLKARRATLPHSWITADEEFGRDSVFRKDLRDLHERYLLVVPANLVVRDLEAKPPAGKRVVRFQKISDWAAARPESAWTRIDVRDGAKGPLVVEIVSRRVQAKRSRRRNGPEELLVVARTRDAEGNVEEVAYHFSNASPDTPQVELARVVKTGHRIEECLQRGKSEAGLADYEVRTWHGWHHHQTLSLIATWFLTLETLRGKKNAPDDDGFAAPRHHRLHAALHLRLPPPRLDRPPRSAPRRADRVGALLPLQETTTPSALAG